MHINVVICCSSSIQNVCGACAGWGCAVAHASSVKHIKCALNWKQEMIITYLVHLAKHTINILSTANYYALLYNHKTQQLYNILVLCLNYLNKRMASTRFRYKFMLKEMWLVFVITF